MSGNTLTTTAADRGYVGLPTDPRQQPVRLTSDYSISEALTKRDLLRGVFPKCEVFIPEK